MSTARGSPAELAGVAPAIAGRAPRCSDTGSATGTVPSWANLHRVVSTASSPAVNSGTNRVSQSSVIVHARGVGEARRLDSVCSLGRGIELPDRWRGRFDDLGYSGGGGLFLCPPSCRLGGDVPAVGGPGTGRRRASSAAGFPDPFPPQRGPCRGGAALFVFAGLSAGRAMRCSVVSSIPTGGASEDVAVRDVGLSGLPIGVPSAAVFLPVPWTCSQCRSVPRTIRRSSAMLRTVTPGLDSIARTAGWAR